MEISFWRNLSTTQRTPRIFISIAFTIFLLGLIPLYFHPFNLVKYHSSVQPPIPYHTKLDQSTIRIYPNDDEGTCNVFIGEWVPNPDGPYYTNTSCWAIHEHQNCMKYGRSDTEFLKWKWKPKRCDLPIFNPYQFLDIMRNKSMAFIGDSVGRNQMQSLICLLSQVDYPIDISYDSDQRFKRWKYTTYNFTLAAYWSPFLVKVKESDPDGPSHTGLFNLYLDQPDEKWTSQIQQFDYLILNSAHWFTRCSVYYEKNQIIGCRYCGLPNVTEIPIIHGYKRALKTSLKAINNLENYKGVTIVRTIAPSHFEGGEWNKGGNCVRERPFRGNETSLDGQSYEFYKTQVEEFKVAVEEGKKKGKKFELLDITEAMLMRGDGHPSKYGHWPNEKVVLYNDCVHWCLPGPIDTLSDFLLHMLKMQHFSSI